MGCTEQISIKKVNSNGIIGSLETNECVDPFMKQFECGEGELCKKYLPPKKEGETFLDWSGSLGF